ncbi:MAG: hypothetical protein Q9221_001037 [Calogaya cf. arnoldii]
MKNLRLSSWHETNGDLVGDQTLDTPHSQHSPDTLDQAESPGTEKPDDLAHLMDAAHSLTSSKDVNSRTIPGHCLEEREEKDSIIDDINEMSDQFNGSQSPPMALKGRVPAEVQNESHSSQSSSTDYKIGIHTTDVERTHRLDSSPGPIFEKGVSGTKCSGTASAEAVKCVGEETEESPAHSFNRRALDTAYVNDRTSDKPMTATVNGQDPETIPLPPHHVRLGSPTL